MKYKRLFSALLVFSLCCSFCESAFALSNSTIAHEDDSDGYNFYTMDEVRVSRTTVITFPNGPYASVKIEGESDLNEFPSKYFYDKNHNLSSGYNHYIAGNISDPITNLVPTVKFSWG